MDPQQEAIGREFDKYAKNYDDEVNRALGFSGLNVDFFTRIKGQHLLDLLGKYLPDLGAACVLDLGCGIGNYHAFVQPHVKALHGVELSSECLKIAKKINPMVEYTHYDGDIIPFKDNHFDAVFTICVMHHVPPQNWPGFVDEIRRVLRPGGIFAVYEHNPYNPLTRLVVNRCEFDRDAVLLRPAVMRKLMSEAGLSAVTTNSIFTIPPSNAILAAIDAKLSALPFGAQYFAVGTK